MASLKIEYRALQRRNPKKGLVEEVLIRNLLQGPVQSNEDGDLGEGWQQGSQGVDLIFLIQVRCVMGNRQQPTAHIWILGKLQVVSSLHSKHTLRAEEK